MRELWPVWGCHPDAGDLYCRDNVILAVPVETQADIERLVSDLLKCHDLCKGLAVVCNPKEELDVAYFLDRVDYDRNDIDCDHENKEIVYEPGIKLLIAEGNEHPMHPDWLRSLRGQCKDANVPFHFAGWGRWLPFERASPPMIESQAGHFIDGHDLPTGITDHEPVHQWRWPNGFSDDLFNDVGKDKSGRLLDGQEHNGRLA